MPKYTYKVILKPLEEIYQSNAKEDVYEVLGNVDFNNASLTITAKDQEESEAICKGVVDVRMWFLESIED
jgi:hypothetical protein